MARLPLPPVELPAGAVLLFEHMAVDDPDRTGNWRFYVSSEGGFYQARNGQLFVDQDDLSRPDPTLFWNAAFPSEPQRRFDDEGMRLLADAIDRVGFGGDEDMGSERVIQVERWSTAPTRTAIALNGDVPKDLEELRRAVDELVARS